ncbi:uncharacterized protein MYCFIDRAFT_204443 [Pseudocercospora fijiensis CIRAD86]|uniref:Oligopeptide transporter n=1 Tax=Pseudocercospora fijiensis (strain CIRAD86) TaxID=383855 RepID=M3A628_PSEFD|nr:uncharacterized protein MYCFIDRAFT_204443 [Pseudocercospora fijiensis CIRAD86]EME80071.1 hypothetical protein MYCFIDRAFT_204443 [Pseudocercospora fijiensis CIRAD86]
MATRELKSVGGGEPDLEPVYTIESDNSPYPEVRANVPNTDDPTLPVNTLRMWFLGCAFALIGSGINSFFSVHYPSVTITSLVTQLISFPAGCGLALILPLKTITIFGYSFCINPDRNFNVKEHTVITIMSNLSFGTSWATDIIQAQKAFYGLKAPIGYQLLLGLTMQLFGLGIAGLAYRFIVEPPEMVRPTSLSTDALLIIQQIWPSTLANAALFETLHSRANPIANGWRISRYRFFLYVFAGSFCWYWFPGFIFTALSTFAFICWAAPNNVRVNNVFGMSSGLGMMPITFDWAQIAYNGSPLVVPFWAQANSFAGFCCFFALTAPILYYTNTWYTSYLPLSSSNSYDNTGAIYNGSRIVDEHGNFDVEAYKAYSPVFMPVTFALGYGISFAVMAALISHIFLYHFQDIMRSFKGNRPKDCHARMIEKYPDAAWWWYAILAVTVLGLSIMTMYVYDIGMPFWGVLIAFGMASLYIVPVGVVYAVANLNSNVLTVLGEIISGYLLPGKPIVMLIFKFYAYTALSQAMNFSSDQKLGLYMKIPRRTLFVAQFVGCVLGSLSQQGVLIWMLGHIDNICAEDQKSGYTCPQGRVNFVSSIVWGAIGPARMYSIGKIYSGLLHMFWLGALLPIVTFLLKKRFPHNKFLNAIHWPIFFAGTGNMPPATGVNYTTAFVASYIFNKYIKNRYKQWWAKYNYVLSAALDSSVAVSAIVLFFCVIFPGASLSWWGNTVNSKTVDGKGTPRFQIPVNGTFGPVSWS